ncbi:DUF3696 domain-containing protein [Schaedlerella arabinosiphila]|uniref:DUF3696 domain-containing protein n=1 Tax=Schaedlerella arabinosiphila TaxID=2044587 RepID=A0A9X5C558_9FIRM|nr:DUF3696 domain-containing protein [Schaedlerella arabinosiphila]KAI4443482.1 hypothetical protein C824_006017 [Schaedlerella arabinosiphila]NDO68209.1 DUF3696 domain-containing protein [Schaedlerella arabinosiphila]
MSDIKIEKIILKNFKCHKNFEANLKKLNILTGSNAAGKSSLVQALLLAYKSWEECEKKRVNTNKIYGMNLGIPLNIVSEDLEEKNIEIELFLNGKKNKVVLGFPDDNDEISFDICNEEDILEAKEHEYNLSKISLFYLNAERKGPRIVSFINDIMPYSVGTSGENTGYVLSELDKLQKVAGAFHLPKDLRISEIDRFSANCEEWLNVIIPDTKIRYSVDVEKNITTVMLQNQGEFHLPIATGLGITYVLPIIVQALAASMIKNSVLIVENPEAHLHPLSQSRLGKFLALAAVNGVQVVLETHSEHIVDGCRIQIAKEKQFENMKILFFEKRDNMSICKNINIQDDGELEEWPEGFFDQKRADLRELLEMRRCGN